MAALPSELDFATDPAATPDRMNRAMTYLDTRFRALESATPAFEAAVDDLRTLALLRLEEALLPIFNNATEVNDIITAIRAEWEDDEFIAGLTEDIVEAVVAEFSDYRSRYLGAHASAPTHDEAGDAVAIGAMYFDTVLDKMQVLGGSGWKDAGSVVSTLIGRQSFTATGGETSVTVPGGYDPGNIVVYVNGLMLLPADVTVTSGTAIGLPALTTGDKVSWVKFTAMTVATVYSKSEVYSKAESEALLRKTPTYATVSGTLAPDFSANDNFVWTLGGNLTLNAPTGMYDGQSGVLYFIQGGAGGWTLTKNAAIRTPKGLSFVLSATAGSVDRCGYFVRNVGGTLRLELTALEQDIK